MNRWWTYQKERFPVAAHGPLIAAFSFCAVSYSRMLRGETGVAPWPALVTAFITCFLFFLQLRIADEFKDFEEDSLYRPYRPVPRGLVRLRELGWIFVFAAAIQLGAALWLAPQMALLLLAPWLYLAAMSKEFFAREWLKARPITYLWTHMLIMPLVDFYASGCDWLARGGKPPAGLGWFLVASFFNGVVIEIGRKLRAPGDEEKGVPTYTVLWGVRRAPIIWWIVLALTGGCACQAAAGICFALPVAVIVAAFALVAGWQAIAFRRSPANGKRFELLAGIWTIVLYLSLGLLPLFSR